VWKKILWQVKKENCFKEKNARERFLSFVRTLFFKVGQEQRKERQQKI
jgi:hypothetical protein